MFLLLKLPAAVDGSDNGDHVIMSISMISVASIMHINLAELGDHCHDNHHHYHHPAHRHARKSIVYGPPSAIIVSMNPGALSKAISPGSRGQGSDGRESPFPEQSGGSVCAGRSWSACLPCATDRPDPMTCGEVLSPRRRLQITKLPQATIHQRRCHGSLRVASRTPASVINCSIIFL